MLACLFGFTSVLNTRFFLLCLLGLLFSHHNHPIDNHNPMEAQARDFLLKTPSLKGLNPETIVKAMETNGIVSLWDISRLKQEDLIELLIPKQSLPGMLAAVEAAGKQHDATAAAAKLEPLLVLSGGNGKGSAAGGSGGQAALPGPSANVRCASCNSAMTSYRGRVPDSYTQAKAATVLDLAGVEGKSLSLVDCDGCGVKNLDIHSDWFHCSACDKVDYCQMCVAIKSAFAGGKAGEYKADAAGDVKASTLR